LEEGEAAEQSEEGEAAVQTEEDMMAAMGFGNFGTTKVSLFFVGFRAARRMNADDVVFSPE